MGYTSSRYNVRFIREFLQNANTTNLPQRIFNMGGLAIGISSATALLEAAFNFLPYVTGPIAGVACFGVFVGWMVINEMYIRPNEINNIMHDVDRELNGENLEQLRERQQFNELIQKALAILMDRQAGQTPVGRRRGSITTISQNGDIITLPQFAMR